MWVTTGTRRPTEPVEEGTLTWTPERADVSSAEAIDEIRTLVVDAWDRGESPDYLLVPPEVRDVLVASKQREVRHGNPVVLLGLIVL